MKQIVTLIFCLVLANCAKVETSPVEKVEVNSNKIVSVSPKIEKDVSLKPIIPNVKFDAEQRKYLDESLPSKVREVLEKSESFAVLAEIDEQEIRETDLKTFQPNRITKITDEKEKKQILESFYFDASRPEYPAACYEPHHAIKAVYQGKTVEIEICFSCAQFIVKSEYGKFEGTILRENRKSEDLLRKIIESKSIEYKP